MIDYGSVIPTFLFIGLAPLIGMIPVSALLAAGVYEILSLISHSGK